VLTRVTARLRIVLAVALVAVGSGTSCGGSEDDDSARAALREYLAAEGQRDADGYCDALTAESRRLVARDIARAGDVLPGTSCVEAVEARFGKAAQPPDYTTAGKVTQPARTTSDRATFLISSPLLKARGEKLAVVLVRRGDSWQVDLRQGGIRPRPAT
jgi:hypothetical protein